MEGLGRQRIWAKGKDVQRWQKFEAALYSGLLSMYAAEEKELKPVVIWISEKFMLL